MAMPRKVPVPFATVFPHGAFMVGEVLPVRDYDRSTRENVVQATDVETGIPVWAVEVVDADPDATKATRTMSVKITAKVQPVPPPAESGLPFRPAEFEGMTATAYIEEKGDFSKIAWSLRAATLREPSRAGKPATESKPSDGKAAA